MFFKMKSAVVTICLVLGAISLFSSVAKAQVEFLGVNKKAMLTNNNTVAIATGSITCTGTFQVSVTILQNHSGTNVAGAGEMPAPDVCSVGVPTTWVVQVPVLNPPNATYSKGPASAVVNAFDPLGDQTITAELQLVE